MVVAAVRRINRNKNLPGHLCEFVARRSEQGRQIVLREVALTRVSLDAVHLGQIRVFVGGQLLQLFYAVLVLVIRPEVDDVWTQLQTLFALARPARLVRGDRRNVR